MKILIIEDDERLLELYQTFQEMLGDESTTIELAKNGTEALTSLKKTLPEVILIDLFLPDMNGMEIVKYLDKEGQLKKTKAYVMTNLSDDHIEKEALNLGATGYVIKSNISFQTMKTLLETGSFVN
jgi:CheY-like chemotaxis protein